MTIATLRKKVEQLEKSVEGLNRALKQQTIETASQIKLKEDALRLLQRQRNKSEVTSATTFINMKLSKTNDAITTYLALKYPFKKHTYK